MRSRPIQLRRFGQWHRIPNLQHRGSIAFPALASVDSWDKLVLCDPNLLMQETLGDAFRGASADPNSATRDAWTLCRKLEKQYGNDMTKGMLPHISCLTELFLDHDMSCLTML